MSDLAVDSIAKPSVTDAYVSEKERVLDPTVLDKSLVERMPEPSGWRLLVLPYKGKGVTDGGIQLLESTVSKENLATSVCYVMKVGPLAYQDYDKFGGEPWCKEGDWVIFARYAGSRFRLNGDKKAAFGSEVRMLNDDEILGTILDPKDIYHG